MGVIAFDDLAPEMVLASDLKTQQGRMLLPKGIELTDKHLQVLKTWGILEADIEGVSEDEVESGKLSQLDPLVIETCDKLVAKRFVNANCQHEAMHELISIFVQRTSKEIAQLGIKRFTREQQGNLADLVLDRSPPGAFKIMAPAFILRDEIELSSLPSIYFQIVEAIKNPRSSAAFVADIIGNDMSLSAKLLRLVNSAFYGFPSKIETLSRAVTIIGTSQLTTLALGISVTTMFKGIPSELIDMKSFWKHSVACGIIARQIAGEIKNVSEERFFVAGLLHDMGRLIMLKEYPEYVKESLLRAEENNALLHTVESDVWGFNHAMLARELLEKWQFPKTLEDSINFHHEPQKAISEIEPGIVHLADIIANSLMLGCSGARYVPPLVPKIWASLGFSKSILPMIVSQVDHQLDDLMRIFFSGDGDG